MKTHPLARIVLPILLLGVLSSPMIASPENYRILLTDGTVMICSIVTNDTEGHRLQVREGGETELKWISYYAVKAITEESTQANVTGRFIPVTPSGYDTALPRADTTMMQDTEHGVAKESAVIKNGRLFYVRGSIGYGAQALNDLNNFLQFEEDLFQSGGVPLSIDKFGGAFVFGGEIGFRVSRILSVGGGVSYQKSSVDNGYSDFSGSFVDQVKLSVTNVCGNMCLWIPDTGLFFGGSAGWGFGKLDRYLSLQIFGDPASSFSLTTTGDGSAFTASGFAGYQATFRNGFVLFGEVGYAFRNLGEFNATFNSAELGSMSGVFQDQTGRAMEFDFSGVYGVAGLGFSIGRIVQ